MFIRTKRQHVKSLALKGIMSSKLNFHVMMSHRAVTCLKVRSLSIHNLKKL